MPPRKRRSFTAEYKVEAAHRYRLGRIEDLTGLDLTVDAHRLELHIGLVLGRFLGLFPSL